MRLKKKKAACHLPRLSFLISHLEKNHSFTSHKQCSESVIFNVLKWQIRYHVIASNTAELSLRSTKECS